MNNLSEEEKKAIKIVEDIAFIRGIRQDVDGEIEDLKAIKDVFRLVDNKQKEIEESIKAHQGYNEEKEKNNTLLVELASNNYISKDKIRNLLKQVNASLYHFKDSEKNNIMQRLKDRLEQLLEE